MEIFKYITGGLNSDDSPEVLPPEDLSYAKNIMIGISPTGQQGAIENIRGTTSISVGGFITANHECIGVLKFKARGKTFLFYRDTVGTSDAILKLENGAITNVCTSTVLDFQDGGYINGGALVGDLLYFADGREGRVINITRYVSSSAGMVAEDLTLIRRGPAYPPTATKDTTAGNPNIIGYNDYQFAYQYVYTDNQVSVMSPYSKFIPQNTKEQDYNEIDVVIPLATEARPNNVKEILVNVRIGNNGVWYTVHKIKNPGLGSDIPFTFTGETSGTLVESHYNFPAEPIPQAIGTMAMAKNKLLIGNYTEGYDTPTVASFTATGDKTTANPELTSAVIKQIDKVTYTFSGGTWDGGDGGVDIGDYTQGPDNLWYQVEFGATEPIPIVAAGVSIYSDPIPGFSTWATLTYYFVGQYVSDPSGDLHICLETHYSGTFATDKTAGKWEARPTRVAYTFNATAPTTKDVDISGYMNLDPTYAGVVSAGRGSAYKAGLIFSSDLGRKSFVVTDAGLKVKTDMDSAAWKFDIDWTLPATAPNTDIPDWATHYSIVYTKNLKKSWFIEGQATFVVFSKQDSAGDKTYTRTIDPDNTYVEVDIRGWVEAGRGYEYKEGDRLIIYDMNNSDWDLKIIGTDGNNVICELSDLNVGEGALPGEDAQPMIEIYTPVAANLDLVYYETGDVYSITDPGGAAKAFGTTAGTIRGDCVTQFQETYRYVKSSYLLNTGEGTLERSGTFVYLGMSSVIDDDGLTEWNTDHGRAYIESSVGEVNRENYVKIGSGWISDSDINGLSEFDPDDEFITPIENGPIQKLQPTTKAQATGDIMLAIGTANTASIYLQETQINIANDTSFFVASEQEVGQIRTMKKGSGTVNPESVFEYNGDVYWWDKLNRAFVRYSSNGIFAISTYKMRKHFEDMAASQLTTDRVVVGFDPYLKLVFVTFESGTNKTVGFSEEMGRWISYYDFAPEFFAEDLEVMYSTVGGAVYSHDSSTYNSFYSTPYDSEIHMSFNQNPNKTKEWTYFMFQGKPTTFYEWNNGSQRVVVNTMSAVFNNHNGQETDLITTDFDVEDFAAHAALYADTNEGGFTNPLVESDPMVSNTLQCELTFTSSVSTYLHFFEMGYRDAV